jgi:PST family polysaccharide transporter
MYVGFVLQAMGADFYPRLAAAVSDRERSNRLVNEQAHVNLLLAGPGVLATLTFAPLVVSAFYSRAFGDSVVLLRWLCLGATLRVITWPMGFIVVAGAMQTLFLALEAAYAVFYILAAWAGVRYLGLTGAGVAFLASYVFHGLLVYPVVRKVSGFRWSASNRRLVPLFLGVVGGVFCALQLLPGWLGTAVGTLAVLGSSVYSARALARLVSVERLPRAIRRLVPARWLSEHAERSGGASP